MVCLHPLIRLPNFALGNTKRFRSIHAGPPFAGCLQNRTGQHRPFGPVPLQNLQPYYGRFRPCAPHRYSDPCEGYPLGLLPSHRDDRFLRSLPKPGSKSRRLHAGRQLGSNQVSPNLIPGQSLPPGFDVGYILFDTSSAVHSRSSPRTLPDGVALRLFQQRSPRKLLIPAACGSLTPAPASRLRGASPHLW